MQLIDYMETKEENDCEESGAKTCFPLKQILTMNMISTMTILVPHPNPYSNKFWVQDGRNN